MTSDAVLHAFARVAARRPSAPLVASAARRWSAGELDGHSARLAARLLDAGFVPGNALGLAAAPGPAFLAGYLALRRIGAVPVLCDGVPPAPDTRAALERIGAVGWLGAAHGWPEDDGAWTLERRHPRAPLAADREWGAIKLTSGTTGEPRGIAVPAASLLADEAQLAATMGLEAGDRLLATVPLSHSYGFSSLALPVFVRGALLVVPESRAPFAPLAAAEALAASFFPTVPAWLGAYVRSASPPPLPRSLRLVVAAGAPLLPEVAVEFRRRTGRAVHVFYGASEAGGIAFDRGGEAADRGTVGTAVEGVALAIDAASGRLEVRSPAVAARFLPTAAGELGGGRFLTGDLARFEGGELRLLGRADDWVIVRGHNVNPREVESALLELDGVAEAVVFGVAGDDGPRSVLRAVVAAPAGTLDAARVAAHLRTRLAEHKVPRSVILVVEIPRNARGKPDREALAAL